MKKKPPDNDFTSTSLQRCRDIIYINVFDEVEVNLPIIEREREQTIHKRISRNWLGSIRIPFANVYINSRLEGTYIVNVPSPLLGYTRDRGSSQARFYSNANLDVPLNPSLLRMFITMEPQLIPPETLVQTLDSTESFELLNHAREWVQELITAFPDRDYKATVSDITGRAVFITRFLHPLTPPPLSIDDSLPPQVAASTTAAPLAANEDRSNIQSQRVARFVSMIPFLSDSIAFPGICDIWETSAQFLQTMAGDDEEHAVLLNNYFTSLNKRAWIALGKSIYSGPCCFVLTQEGDRKFSCWSVSDGVGVSTRDTWNQIQNIYLLANEENVRNSNCLTLIRLGMH
ncbi:unnamed protein product [Didymodactylos carnosus]|uniref:CEP76/DRC7 peptidase-like domain-containing protein n=1 Tax=Didymodactylos carnosus TaxID=1234261 RepID=A0A814SSS6_9BILA|nr:unnamed protein product [Didymodactylos carnosus]CAF3915907.1 unnamed protein product [Didymodactylos carnosus]